MHKHIDIKQFLSLLITVSAVLLLFSIYYYIISPTPNCPEAVQGRLDLSNWDFQSEEIVFLNGQWEFYPQDLLQPEDLAAKTPYWVKVPGSWKGSGDYVQPAKGNGTYHISVKLPKLQEPLVLKIQNVWMAHRIFINGTLVREMGRPASSLQAYQPKNTPYSIILAPATDLEIVLQVSNQVYYTGGIAHPIQLGAQQAMDRKSHLAFGSDMAGFFLFLLFGIYHLQMYQMREKERTYLYSGFFLLCISIISLTTGEKLLMQLFEAIPFGFAYKLQDFSLFASFALLALFIRSLEPAAIKKRTMGFILLPIIIYLGLIILTPYHIFTAVKVGITFYANLLLFFLAIRFIYILVHKKERQLPLNESSYAVAAIAFVGIMLFDSALYYSGQINDNLIAKLSLFGALLVLNVFQSRRFSNKMNEVQALSMRLQKANEIKDEFLARTSHELKTPLHGIMNISTHLLKVEPFSLTREQRENLSLIQDTSTRLSLLVNDLTDLIKLRHEDLQLKPVAVDLYVAVQVVFQLLSFDLQGRDVRLINRVAPMTFVEADENRLRQILYNLSANAMKYTERGEIAAQAEGEEAGIVLNLSDTGRGIPEEQWEQIFEDFYRDPLSYQQFNNGMGLGLYISRQLARKMKGDLWISHSILEKGTTLSLRLPKGKPLSIGPALETERAQEPYAMETFDPQGTGAPLKRILLVDDEPTNIRVLSLMLEGEYQISTVYGGEEALKMLQSQKFHLVIADMMMPGMSGIELTQRIRQIYSIIDLPIIIATVRDRDRDIELAYQSGANDYITKPFTAEEIRSRVRILLQLMDTMETALQNEIAFLQAQIKPHFIYNALSNIIALCYEDGEKAAELLSLLSRYLRYIFQADQSAQMLSLQRELDIIKAYVEIERIRFGGRLHYETYIDPGVLKSEIMIPALLLQPLIENAIRHGLFNKQEPGTVALTITEGADFIRIVVEDDGVGMSDDQVYQITHGNEAKGVGLRNIQKRVASFPKASFSIDSELEKGTRCTLFLPKELLRSLTGEVI